ncbi:MAG: HEAT repeat domain-containing protein [Myxococcota bacterium]
MTEPWRLDDDDEARWAAVLELHRRPDPATFALAAGMCASPDPDVRRFGIDVLAQLGVEDRPFRADALPILARALDDPEPAVAAAAAVALGHHHLEVEDGVHPALVALGRHPDPRVRLGVVHGLLGLDDASVVAALIAASEDPDPRVRDWATFGLGTALDLDTPAIRAALVARVDDPDPDVREEAEAGLRARGVSR